MQRDELISEVLRAQQVFLRARHAMMAPSWLQLHLTTVQLRALFALARQTVSVGELAGQLGIGKPAASILTEQLVQMALVQRMEDPEDRRRMLVSLTDEGEQAVTELVEGGRERFRSLLDRVSEEDLTALARGLQALTRAAAEIEPVPIADDNPRQSIVSRTPSRNQEPHAAKEMAS